VFDPAAYTVNAGFTTMQGQPFTSGGNDQFMGHKDDPESGLHYNLARSYNPAISRWGAPDSIVANAYDPQSLNKYGYNRNDPVNYVDPSGNSYEDFIWWALSTMWDQVSDIYNFVYNLVLNDMMYGFSNAEYNAGYNGEYNGEYNYENYWGYPGGPFEQFNAALISANGVAALYLQSIQYVTNPFVYRAPPPPVGNGPHLELKIAADHAIWMVENQSACVGYLSHLFFIANTQSNPSASDLTNSSIATNGIVTMLNNLGMVTDNRDGNTANANILISYGSGYSSEDGGGYTIANVGPSGRITFNNEYFELNVEEQAQIMLGEYTHRVIPAGAPPGTIAGYTDEQLANAARIIAGESSLGGRKPSPYYHDKLAGKCKLWS
jgi:RHS repeat-associated protein